MDSSPNPSQHPLCLSGFSVAPPPLAGPAMAEPLRCDPLCTGPPEQTPQTYQRLCPDSPAKAMDGRLALAAASGVLVE